MKNLVSLSADVGSVALLAACIVVTSCKGPSPRCCTGNSSNQDGSSVVDSGARTIGDHADSGEVPGADSVGGKGDS